MHISQICGMLANEQVYSFEKTKLPKEMLTN